LGTRRWRANEKREVRGASSRVLRRWNNKGDESWRKGGEKTLICCGGRRGEAAGTKRGRAPEETTEEAERAWWTERRGRERQTEEKEGQ